MYGQTLDPSGVQIRHVRIGQFVRNVFRRRNFGHVFTKRRNVTGQMSNFVPFVFLRRNFSPSFTIESIDTGIFC